MDSLYFLIPIAVVFVALAIKVFFWAVNNGQYDDLETEGRRILFEDDLQASSTKTEEKE
ncbi:cbb3-type cytochrome oxidase assembly protein CcoS [Microbulbifer variabilis]|uniref:Cbb3-type cytochrome oxidase assembly protein CcoS n=1 Tax=Microbulbifer variabilis TaxID=266805 RepID=A0ABY4VE61_9GAMM|nr:cbb3-type cytochrome oxidase assembly protein CcoS [Microbulbifer variabilis]USD22594.1 cbb3-type cytochrome oxidase assembly protein CcoS [Microbulbifer variabilis]